MSSFLCVAVQQTSFNKLFKQTRIQRDLQPALTC